MGVVSPQVVYFGINERLVLSKDGLWLSNGQEITHEGTVRAFFRNLHPDDSGNWRVRIGPEEKSVELEDTPAFVQSLEGSAEHGYQLVLLGADEQLREPLAPLTLQYTAGRLTCRLRSGWEARFLHAAYHEILRHIQQDTEGYYLKIKGARVGLSSPRTPSRS